LSRLFRFLEAAHISKKYSLRSYSAPVDGHPEIIAGGKKTSGRIFG